MTVSADDYGLKAWTFDPVDVHSGAALGAGVISLVGLKVRFPTRVSAVRGVVTTAGATVANAFAGIYSQAGARLGVTADQSTPWQSLGNKSMALAAAVDLVPGWYYVALLFGTAGTPPQFARGPAGAVAAHNAGMAAPKLRQAISGAAQTALPTTIATGGLDPATGINNFWAGLS
jgi:hypothetical protein